MELQPGDDTYVGRAHSLAAEMRDAARTLDRIPELYLPYERGEVTLRELLEDIADDRYELEDMDTLLGELLDEDDA